MEIILESSEKIIPAEDKLRSALSEIMKENEKLKKDYHIKLKEIDKLNGEKAGMQVNLNRLNKKIQSLKNKKNERLDGEGNQNQAKKDEEAKKVGDGTENLLKLDNLPARLDYRNSF